MKPPARLTFTPEYKASITDDFIDCYLRGYRNVHLGQRFFGGSTYTAEHFIRKLKRRELLEKGPRPDPAEDTPHPYETVEEHPKFVSLRETQGMPNVGIVRQSHGLYKRLVQEQDRTGVILESIRAMPPLPPMSIPSPQTARGEVERVIKAQVSDTHPGQLVTAPDSAGIEWYDRETFHRRGDALLRHYSQKAMMFKNTFPVNTWEFDFLGDNLEGEGIYPLQGLFTDMCTMDQMIEARDLYARLIQWAAMTFPKVRCRFVRGNHGRSGERGKNHYRTNWDDVLALLLQTLFRDQENVEFIVSASTEMVYYVPELGPQINFINVHGEKTNRRGLRNLRDQYAGFFNLPLNYVLAGHFHNPQTEDIAHGAVSVNGSFVGTNPYGKDDLRVANAPKQLLYVFHPHVGLESRHDLYLDNMNLPRLEAQANGVFTPLYA